MSTDAQREVHAAYKPGKRAKRVIVPREARHRGHPHLLAGAADLHRHPMPDSGQTRVPRDSHITREHAQMVERNLGVLGEVAPELVRSEVEIYKDKLAEIEALDEAASRDGSLTGPLPPILPGDSVSVHGSPAKRAQYAALETHREMASVILSAGGTFDEAADHAGVARGTVAKWYTEVEFRRRVDEQRAIVLGKVRGRIEAWMDRRTADPATLDAADPKITLAIHDRVAGGARGAGASAGQGTSERGAINVNILTYTDLMEVAAGAARRRPAQAQVDVDDTGEEGGGFPLIGSGGLPVAGDGAQSD